VRVTTPLQRADCNESDDQHVADENEIERLRTEDIARAEEIAGMRSDTAGSVLTIKNFRRQLDTTTREAQARARANQDQLYRGLSPPLRLPNYPFAKVGTRSISEAPVIWKDFTVKKSVRP
jgi:hypothetical protein